MVQDWRVGVEAVKGQQESRRRSGGGGGGGRRRWWQAAVPQIKCYRASGGRGCGGDFPGPSRCLPRCKDVYSVETGNTLKVQWVRPHRHQRPPSTHTASSVTVRYCATSGSSRQEKVKPERMFAQFSEPIFICIFISFLSSSFFEVALEEHSSVWKSLLFNLLCIAVFIFFTPPYCWNLLPIPLSIPPSLFHRSPGWALIPPCVLCPTVVPLFLI